MALLLIGRSKSLNPQGLLVHVDALLANAPLSHGNLDVRLDVVDHVERWAKKEAAGR